MAEFAIGIDLGTSTSEVCVYQNGQAEVIRDPITKSPIIPSIVAIDRQGHLLVGEAARAYVDVPGHGIREVKRLMGSGELIQLGGKEFRPEEISAMILKHLKGIAEEAVGASIEDTVLTVPANFEDSQKSATFNAGELAGLNIVRLVNEPTAAALAFGSSNIDLEEKLVVIDFGGGTLDVSVLEMFEGVLEVNRSYGDSKLGGKEFDEALFELILRNFRSEYPACTISERSLSDLKRESEKAKILLSYQDTVTVRLSNFAFHNGDPIDLEDDISRYQFDSEVAPILQRTEQCIRKAIEGEESIEAYKRILLIGGTTNMPAVRRRIAEVFKQEPSVDINPDLAVSMGAAIQAALANGITKVDEDVIITDVSPFGLGVSVLSFIGGQWIETYDPLILPNTTIPFSTTKDYSLTNTQQDTLEVRIFQDHAGTARVPAEAMDTGISGEVVKIPPSPSDIPHTVQIEFSYDINGIAKLNAVLPATGQVLGLSYDQSDTRMDDSEKANAIEDLEELWNKSNAGKKHRPLLKRAQDAVDLLDDDQKSQFLKTIRDLQQAITSGNLELAEHLAAKLTDQLFDLEIGR